jgi:hypothetical protein
MRRLGRLSGLGLLVFVGCGGAQTVPSQPPPESAPVAKEPIEKADLSPVAAPPELFVVGRLKRPGPIADTLGKWAGLPVSLRTLLGKELHGMDAVIAWDAPVELAVALPSGGRRHDVAAVVSVGLSSLGGMLSAARERGLSPERILPEVFGFAGPSGVRCVVGPALGSASARLVCGDHAQEVEQLFAYATRGLPNENLGNRDLELELRAEPLRRRFSSEIAGTRLFAGFLLRQIELDSPRFDRALADAAYGVADELVLEVEDTDSFKLGGSLDDANKTLSLELAWKFRSTRSWFAGYVSELSRRPGPPPPAFERLPAKATSAGYAIDTRSERSAPVKSALIDIADAYLEYEHAAKASRERSRRFLTSFLQLVGTSYVQSKGGLDPAVQATEAAKKLGWHVSRVEAPAAEFERLFTEFNGLVGDRELWKILAKRLELDPKVQPRSKLAPLKGKGIPAGARALVVTVPSDLTEGIQKRAGSRFKVETKGAMKIVVAVCPDGPGAVIVATSDEKDATERLRAFFATGGERLAGRADLAPLRSGRALYAEFFTLLGLFEAFSNVNLEKAGAHLPNHGETPVIWSYTAASGPPLMLSAAVTVPAAALADAPGIATSIDSF